MFLDQDFLITFFFPFFLHSIYNKNDNTELSHKKLSSIFQISLNFSTFTSLTLLTV